MTKAEKKKFDEIVSLMRQYWKKHQDWTDEMLTTYGDDPTQWDTFRVKSFYYHKGLAHCYRGVLDRMIQDGLIT